MATMANFDALESFVKLLISDSRYLLTMATVWVASRFESSRHLTHSVENFATTKKSASLPVQAGHIPAPVGELESLK